MGKSFAELVGEIGTFDDVAAKVKNEFNQIEANNEKQKKKLSKETLKNESTLKNILSVDSSHKTTPLKNLSRNKKSDAQSVGQSPAQSVGQSPAQSVGQSVKDAQSVGQSPAQSVGQSPAQSVGQSPPQDAQSGAQSFFAQSVGQSPAQSVGQSPAQSVGQSPAQSVGQSPTQSVGQSPTQSVGQSPAQSVGQSPAQSVGQSPAQSVGQSPAQSVGQSPAQSVGQKNIIESNNLSYLTDNQKLVFLSLIDKEEKPTSNKIISSETGVTYGSVRNAIRTFVKLGLITKPILCRFRNNKGFTFKFTKKVKLHGQSVEQSVEKFPALIDREIDSLYKKNLSLYWSNQGLTQKQIDKWIRDFDLSEDEMETFLLFAEHTKKIIEANNPVNYFHGCLKKNGGIPRPKGYELPEEYRARLKKEELEARMRLVAEEEKLRQQEKKLAEKEAFLALLKDKEIINEAIKEFEKGHMTPKFKISIKTFRDNGHVDERLETRLKMWFRDSNECE